MTAADDRSGPDAELAHLRAALAAAEARIAAHEGMLHALNRAHFGSRAERIDPGQLVLALGRDVSPPPPANDAPGEEERRGRAPARRNRGALPAHLERIERVLEPSSRACPCCGAACA